MASEELVRSWQRTEGFLREARSALPDADACRCTAQLRDFEEYLDHNELELALDMLEAAFDESKSKSWRVMEFMAMAAANMRLDERRDAYDRRISEARNETYITQLDG